MAASKSNQWRNINNGISVINNNGINNGVMASGNNG